MQIKSIAIAIVILLFAPTVLGQDNLSDAQIYSMAWSQNGSYIATGHANGEVRILDVLTGENLFTLSGHTGRILEVAWSPSGSRLASGSADKTVGIWDTSNGTLLRTLTGHTDAVSAVIWSQDNTKVVSGSVDESLNLRIWDASTGQLLQSKIAGSNVTFAWSPNGSTLAAANLAGNIELLSGSTFDSMELFKQGEGEGRSVFSVAWNPSGNRLASGDLKGRVRVSDASTGQILLALLGNDSQTLDLYISAILSLKFSSDGNKLFAISANGTLRTWNATTGQVLETTQLATTPIYAASWSPDGQKLAYGFEGGFDIAELPITLMLTPSEMPTLLELLSAPSCSIACFLGIEPGVTTKSEMEAILNERGIAYESHPIGRGGHITSYNLSFDNLSPFINSTGIPTPAGVMLGDDIVEQIDISLINVTVSDVLAAYGAPEVVGKTGAFVLVYPSRGLVFFISRTDPTVVDLVYIRTQVSTQAVFGDVAPCVDQPIICNIQTATAVPAENIMPTATATPTPSD